MHVQSLGKEMWQLLSDMTELIHEPERQQQRLLVHAMKCFEKGMHSWHVDELGNTLEGAMRSLLGSAWEDRHGEAFRCADCLSFCVYVYGCLCAF